jgi:hypothetical protein
MELNTYHFRRIRTYRSATAFIETEDEKTINVKAKDRDAAEAKDRDAAGCRPSMRERRSPDVEDNGFPLRDSPCLKWGLH